LATTEIDDNYEVTLTVRGTEQQNASPALATLYNGTEATFNIWLYPAGYDTNNLP
jgi:phosphotransferase system HPr-like phosphotransfer protein